MDNPVRLSKLRLPLNRLLAVAPPGQGKTTLLTAIVQRFRSGGMVFDPIGELSNVAGIRWDIVTQKRYEFCSDGEIDDICKRMADLPPGSAIIGDEFGRWLPSGLTDNPILQFLDVARNRGLYLALAEKRPTRLHALATDLADAFLYRPWRSASARRWLSDAGLDPDLPAPGKFEFYGVPVGQDVTGIARIDDLADNFGFHLDIDPIAE